MIGNNIQDILDKQGISINMLAKVLGRDYAGVHRLVNRDSLDTTPLATLVEIADYLQVDIKKLYEGDAKMLKLKELMEGGEIGVMFKGTLSEVVEYLEENEDLYDWVQYEDPDMELPELENIETIRDLKTELEKVNLDWWSLEVEEIELDTMFDKEKIIIRTKGSGGDNENNYEYFAEGFEEWAEDLDITIADMDHLEQYLGECGYKVIEIVEEI